MDLALSDAEEAFRAELRDFFAHDYPRAILARMRRGQALTRADHVASQQALHSRGWLGGGWPREHGGAGWSPVERYLFDEALDRAGAPALIPMAIHYIGPIICAFGTPDQQRRWLPDILASRALWAQGYSEPEAGSDLASLRLEARRDGPDYLLDGTKIWTTGAHWADWIFCLARTSIEPRRQDGLSLICADMRTPGITVHPIITIDGGHELNRVEFQAVRVPAANRIGEEGRGWHYANVLLQAERLSYAHIGRKRADLARIRAIAADGARPPRDDPGFARRLAAVEIEVDTLEIMVLRALTGQATAAAVSALKILCTECAQHVSELLLECAGRHALAMPDVSAAGASLPFIPAFAPGAARSYLFERAQTIYGGTTEVQKAIVWRSLAR